MHVKVFLFNLLIKCQTCLHAKLQQISVSFSYVCQILKNRKNCNFASRSPTKYYVIIQLLPGNRDIQFEMLLWQANFYLLLVLLPLWHAPVFN